MIHPLQIISFGVLNSFRLASSSLRQSMAPSQVSGKKMRALLFGVILGIFAVVHSVTSNGKRNFFINLFFSSQPALFSLAECEGGKFEEYAVKSRIRYHYLYILLLWFIGYVYWFPNFQI